MEKGMNFLLYGNQFKRLYEKEITALREEYDLKKIDIEIMYYLYHFENNDTPKDIFELGFFNKGHISQSVCHMQECGFINCVQDAQDRRCIHLRLTDKALMIVEKIENIHKRVNEILFDGISEQEKQQIITTARKIYGNIENALENNIT